MDFHEKSSLLPIPRVQHKLDGPRLGRDVHPQEESSGNGLLPKRGSVITLVYVYDSLVSVILWCFALLRSLSVVFYHTKCNTLQVLSQFRVMSSLDKTLTHDSYGSLSDNHVVVTEFKRNLHGPLSDDSHIHCPNLLTPMSGWCVTHHVIHVLHIQVCHREIETGFFQSVGQFPLRQSGKWSV